MRLGAGRVKIGMVLKGALHTRAVCRKYYIHPAIMEAYLDGTLTQSLNSPAPRPTQTGVSSEEAAVLQLLKRRLTTAARRSLMK